MTSDVSSLKTHLAMTRRVLDEARRTQDVLAEVAQRNRMALELLASELAGTDACPHDRPQCSRAGDCANCADCWISHALDEARAVQATERREREHGEAVKQERAKIRQARMELKAGDAGEPRRAKARPAVDLDSYRLGAD